MDQLEGDFLDQNKCIDEKLDDLIYLVESRLDKLYRRTNQPHGSSEVVSHGSLCLPSKHHNEFSDRSFSTFKEPYIRDFRDFGAPETEDSRQIRELPGENNIDALVRAKLWTKETCQKLKETVLDYYSKLHLIKLIKQKNQLLNAEHAKQNEDELAIKLQLIEEQAEQVKARTNPRIFVPQDKLDKKIDWCAISATLSASQHDPQDCRLMWSNKLHWSINDEEWKRDEDRDLIKAVMKHGKNNWDQVAEDLNTGRLPWQCCARYNQEYAHTQLQLDKDEASKIVEVVNLCRIGNYVPWSQVMHFVQYHGLNQVKYQWQKHCAEHHDMGPWTVLEDHMLLRAVKIYGDKDWARISFAVPGRSNKSCRERYTMRLKYPTRTVGSFRPFEDLELKKLVDKYGTNWAQVADLFLTRNCHQLRNRFEVLKNPDTRRGFVKHRKLHRNKQGEFINHAARCRKPQSEVEVDQQLRQIFTTYSSLNKNSTKKLTCRSAQDEIIYQTVVQVLCDSFLQRHAEYNLLETIIKKAIDPQPELINPCVPTLRAYKAWSLQQDYLAQFQKSSIERDSNDSELDGTVLRIVESIFLWPAVLARMKPPDVDVTKYQLGSVIGKDAKNLYKIRGIQARITR